MKEEIWRPVPGFEGSHSVSNFGRVRYEAILNTRISRRGYVRCTLAAKGRRADPHIHVLVAAAFLGPRPPGHHVHHKDGNKLNPRLDNLEYVSPEAHGVLTAAQGVTRGTNNARARLTEDDVRAIRAADCQRGRKIRWAELAKRYGVSEHTIRSIRERSTWKHVN